MLFITKQHKKVYCRYLCVPILFLLMTNIGIGQRLSPLIQFMSSNTTIERPTVFREMQANIEKETGSTKPGVNADYLFEKIADAKNKLLNKTKVSFSIEKKTDVKVVNDESDKDKKATKKITIVKLEFTCKTNDGKKTYTEEWELEKDKKSIKMVLKDYEKKLRVDLVNLSENILPSDEFPITKNSIILALGNSLKDKALIQRNYDKEKLEEILSAILIEQLQKHILDRVGNTLIKIDDPIDKYLDTLIYRINKVGESLNDRMREILREAFTTAEEKLTSLIKSTSAYLVSANTGIGITEGTGMLNGGLHISWKSGECFQLGLYMNGELAREDTTQPSRSLIGGQMRFICNDFQLDLLGSYLFGDRNFNDRKHNKAFEYGLGLSANVGALIIGLSTTSLKVYDDVANDFEGLTNIVFTFRGSSPGSPVFMIGGAKDGKGVYKTVFNLSLPFN